MNTDSIGTMCGWERKKACFLILEAEKLSMDTSRYGEVAVNQNSGNTYLWLEDHDFCLYMPINCELVRSDIEIVWTDSESGQEVFSNLGKLKTLKEIEHWTERLSRRAGYAKDRGNR